MKLNELPTEVLPVAKSFVDSMKEGKTLEVVYNDEPRMIEVHAVGLSSRGIPCARVYQVIGGAKFTAEQSGWKMLTLEKVTEFQHLNIKSLGPRPGYRPNDTGMGTIFEEISNVPVPAD